MHFHRSTQSWSICRRILSARGKAFACDQALFPEAQNYIISIIYGDKYHPSKLTGWATLYLYTMMQFCEQRPHLTLTAPLFLALSSVSALVSMGCSELPSRGFLLSSLDWEAFPCACAGGFRLGRIEGENILRNLPCKLSILRLNLEQSRQKPTCHSTTQDKSP